MRGSIVSLSVCALTALFCAGCGSATGGSGSNPDFSTSATPVTSAGETTASSAPPPATTLVKRPDPADQATAQSTLVRLGDLNTGWHPDSSVPVAKVCAGDNAGIVQTAGKRAAFEDLDHHALRVDAALYHTAAMAHHVYAERATQATVDCIARYLESDTRRRQSGAITVGHVTAQRIPQGALGDEAVAYRFSMPVSSQGSSATIVVETISFRKGRELGVLESIGLGAHDAQRLGTLDARADQRLTALMAQRADGA